MRFSSASNSSSVLGFIGYRVSCPLHIPPITILAGLGFWNSFLISSSSAGVSGLCFLASSRASSRSFSCSLVG